MASVNSEGEVQATAGKTGAALGKMGAALGHLRAAGLSAPASCRHLALSPLAFLGGTVPRASRVSLAKSAVLSYAGLYHEAMNPS